MLSAQSNVLKVNCQIDPTATVSAIDRVTAPSTASSSLMAAFVWPCMYSHLVDVWPTHSHSKKRVQTENELLR